jgi:cyanophycinase
MEATDDAGELFVIGGAEDKLRRRTVLREFVASAGGEAARIAVVPTASSLGPEIVEVYQAVFTRLGAAQVIGVRPESREQARDPAYAEQLTEVTGIFMTGGNQLKLSSVVAGTPFGEAIVAAHRRGATVGGTSAGASIQSSHMVAFGPGGATPKQRMTQVAAGLGLVDDCVIDQHFEQRNRYGRLLMIVAQNPQLLGLGVDEDTAAIVRRVDGSLRLRVVGRGAVTILDPADLVTNA